VQEQVDDEQGGKNKAYIIVHGYPLVAGDTQVGGPAAAPPSALWKNEIQETSLEMRYGMNVIRQPISISALMVMRVIRDPHDSLDGMMAI